MFLDQIVRKQQKQVEHMASTKDRLQQAIKEAMKEKSPPIPTKAKPDAGIRVLGLPVPETLRERLLIQKEHLELPTYKSSIFLAIRVGLFVLENRVDCGITDDTVQK